MAELKPCPFCGGEAEATKGKYMWWCKCKMCGALSEVKGRKSEAIEAWNRRAGEQDG